MLRRMNGGPMAGLTPGARVTLLAVGVVGILLVVGTVLAVVVLVLSQGPLGVALGLVPDPEAAALNAELQAFVNGPADTLADRLNAAGLSLVGCFKPEPLGTAEVSTYWSQVPRVDAFAEIVDGTVREASVRSAVVEPPCW